MMNFSFEKNANLMGRFECSNPEAPVAGWVNSAVFLKFQGTSISMTAEDTNGSDYVEIVLDGVARNWIQIKKENNEYMLEEHLPDCVHTLEIQKRTDILYGLITFRGFTVSEGGYFSSPPTRKKIHLEYYGDSITCGCGNGHPHELNDAPQLDDGYMSYVGISARLLCAEYHTIFISGIGILQDAMGRTNGLPAHFHGILGAGSKTWDFSQYKVDAAVINLGQNDYSNPIDDNNILTPISLLSKIF